MSRLRPLLLIQRFHRPLPFPTSSSRALQCRTLSSSEVAPVSSSRTIDAKSRTTPPLTFSSEDKEGFHHVWKVTKRQYPEALVLVQCGEFFETFNSDAVETSEILDVILTRKKIKGNVIEPMAGVPVRTISTHLEKLTKAGRRVALIEQVDDNNERITTRRFVDPASGTKKVVIKRAVTRIVTPGTLTEEGHLSSSFSNNIASVFLPHSFLTAGINHGVPSLSASNDGKDGDFIHYAGIAFGDVSTGECRVRMVERARLRDELALIAPRELLISRTIAQSPPSSLAWLFSFPGCSVTAVDDATFTGVERRPLLSTNKMSELERSAYAALEVYVRQNLYPSSLSPSSAPIFRLRVRGNEGGVGEEVDDDGDARMRIDSNTLRSLDVTFSQRSTMMNGGTLTREGSIFHAIDRCESAPGRRLLISRLEAPLLNKKRIEKRLDTVEFFVRNRDLCARVRREIRKLRDFKRSLQRIAIGKYIPSDLTTIAASLTAADAISRDIAATLEGNAMGDEIRECLESMSGMRPIKIFDESGLKGVGRMKAMLGSENLPTGFSVGRISGENREGGNHVHFRTLSELREELERAFGVSGDVGNKRGENANVEKEEASRDDDDGAPPPTTGGVMSSPSSNYFTIVDGYNASLDEYRRRMRAWETTGGSNTKDSSSDWSAGDTGFIEELQNRYREETGIKSLRLVKHTIRASTSPASPRFSPSAVSSNRSPSAHSFGVYLVDVPKSEKHKLSAAAFFLVSELKNSSRFSTKELNARNRSTREAEDKADELEAQLIELLRNAIVSVKGEIDAALDSLARMDVGCALAETARALRYVRPVLNEKEIVLRVKSGRHPVVERNSSCFVANDVDLSDENGGRVWLLTAPNASGKSTFLRQNAAIVILAQCGSFVPSDYAEMGLVDRIFARVGASDDLVNNRSTFVIEMQEAAAFLTQATERSLVIVDELGRGTSPEEGYAIARATLERLAELGCRTLFATHFHRLAEDIQSGNSASKANPTLAPTKSRVSLHTTKVVLEESTDVLNMNGDDATSTVMKASAPSLAPPNPIFTFQVVPGTASSSYGIHCGRIAGVPEDVLKRAEQILSENRHKYH